MKMSLIQATRSTFVATMSVAVLILAGCATMGAAQPEVQVKQRAEAYWKARAAGQAEQAYEFTTPSYRKVHTFDQYKMQFGKGASIKGVSVIKVDCEAEKCTVRTKVEAAPALMGVSVGTIATHLDEIWLLEDGQWWRYQDI